MGKFITLLGSDGNYYFNLIASNGQVILSSEPYRSDLERNKGIHYVQSGFVHATRFERRISADGLYYFLVRSGNGEIIGKSRFYESEASRDNGMEAVKNNARDAEVVWA